MVGLFSIPWVGRGYITSGYPLYPSELGRINFDWMVPTEAGFIREGLGFELGTRAFSRFCNCTDECRLVSAWVATTLADPIVLKSIVLCLAGIILIASSRPWLYRRDSWFRLGFAGHPRLDLRFCSGFYPRLTQGFAEGTICFSPPTLLIYLRW